VNGSLVLGQLKGLIQRSGLTEIMYSQHVKRDGKLLFQEVCERNLEGIVCKRRASVYAEHGWLKVKNPRYMQSEGRREMFEAFQERRKSGKIRSKHLS
jgi:ATP-dependent DNA ligase